MSITAGRLAPSSGGGVGSGSVRGLPFLLVFCACGPAGGPDGRALAGDAMPRPVIRPIDAGTSTVTDAGFRDPSIPDPTLESIREKVFITSCGDSQCHDAITPAEGLDLMLPQSELRARLMRPATQSPSGLPLIAPGEIGRSYLYTKVFLNVPVSGERMPLGRPVLRTEIIQVLKDWIIAGAN